MAAGPNKNIYPSDLMSIPEDEIDHVVFHLCPDVYIVQYKYPFFDIDEIVQSFTTNAITLKPEGSYGIITRKENEIYTKWITKDNWHFIESLLKGEALLKSSEYAQNFNHNLDLGSAIAFTYGSFSPRLGFPFP
jgi:hypothetical protein